MNANKENAHLKIMIELEYVDGFWAGWVDGQFVTIHKDIEILMSILQNY